VELDLHAHRQAVVEDPGGQVGGAELALYRRQQHRAALG
jgi:hypothetical protein